MNIHKQRINKLLSDLIAHGIVVTNINNVFYMSGFTGSTAILFISPDKQILITDSRYTLQATNECPDYEIIEHDINGPIVALKDFINTCEKKDNNLPVIGFEDTSITYSTYKDLTQLEATLTPTDGIIEKLREIKDSTEIQLIKKSAKILDKVANLFDNIEIGISEYELAANIEFQIKMNPYTEVGFETIVAYGENAACPHHSPIDTIIKEGSMLKIDFGSAYKKYNADVTRTIFIGKPDSKFLDIYKIVKDAKALAIEAIKPGMVGSEIDKIARDYIAKYGYGEYFGHGLGHSLGIECHDGMAFSKKSEVELKPGFVATVEPGIYIPNWGGIRLEDNIIVTETGSENITNIKEY